MTIEKLIKLFEKMDVPSSSSELDIVNMLERYKTIVYSSDRYDESFAFDVDVIDCWDDTYWQATVYVENLRTKEHWNDCYRHWYDVIIDNNMESNGRKDHEDLANRIMELQQQALDMHKALDQWVE